MKGVVIHKRFKQPAFLVLKVKISNVNKGILCTIELIALL